MLVSPLLRFVAAALALGTLSPLSPAGGLVRAEGDTRHASEHTEPLAPALRLGAVVGQEGGLLTFGAGWRVTLGPGLRAGLAGPTPTVAVAAPWQAGATSGGTRCRVRTEAADADAVYVTVRIDRGDASRTSLLRWELASGRWSEARPG